MQCGLRSLAARISSTPLAGSRHAGGLLSASAPRPLASAKLVAVICVFVYDWSLKHHWVLPQNFLFDLTVMTVGLILLPNPLSTATKQMVGFD
jgi:hypothetical protein